MGFCKWEYLPRSRFPLLFRVADKLCDYIDSIFQCRRCIPDVSRFQYRAWVIFDLYVCAGQLGVTFRLADFHGDDDGTDDTQ